MSALAESGGVFWVARGGAALDVRAFDGDGAPLEAGFRWSAADGATLGAGALAVDGDHRLWIADRRAALVRVFNVFGVETHRFGGVTGPLDDRAGHFGRPTALAARGTSDDLELVVGSGGERRHGVQLFGPDGRLVRSLRPDGRSQGRFRGVIAVAHAGERVFAAEPTGRVHVWRRREFLHGFVPREALPHAGERDALRALAALPDGALVVAFAGPAGLVLFDAGGRYVRTLLPGLGGGAADVVADEVVAVAVAAGGAREPAIALLDHGGARLTVVGVDGACRGQALALA